MRVWLTKFYDRKCFEAKNLKKWSKVFKDWFQLVKFINLGLCLSQGHAQRLWQMQNLIFKKIWSLKVCIDMTGCWAINFCCLTLMSNSSLCVSQLSCLPRTEMFMGCATFSNYTGIVLGKPEQLVTLHARVLFSGFMLWCFEIFWLFLKKQNKTKNFSSSTATVMCCLGFLPVSLIVLSHLLCCILFLLIPLNWISPQGLALGLLFYFLPISMDSSLLRFPYLGLEFMFSPEIQPSRSNNFINIYHGDVLDKLNPWVIIFQPNPSPTRSPNILFCQRQHILFKP